jgi:hypothetical protein
MTGSQSTFLTGVCYGIGKTTGKCTWLPFSCVYFDFAVQ